MDDLPKSPYNLKYHGYERRGSDTAYKFQLEMHKVDPTAVDLDGPEYGDCAEMSFRDIGVAICKWAGFTAFCVPFGWVLHHLQMSLTF